MPSKPATRTTPVMSQSADAAGTTPLFELANLQVHSWKALFRWQEESLEFLRRRYAPDVRLVDDLLDNPEPAEMLNVYSCFLHNALDDYAREAAKAASLGGRIMTDAAREIRHQAKARTEDLMASTVA
jgi:hypothetical protein